MLSIHQILRTSPIVPVCVIEDAAHAIPLANALLEGGIKTCEVTLRTPKALEAIEAIRKALPEMIVGAGSVLSILQCEEALKAGSQFIVAPGLMEDVVLYTRKQAVPFLPGVMTPSEILKGLSLGVEAFKLFPAEVAGGVNFLNAINGTIASAQFCPTGGITLSNMNDYLACPNVLAVGGTWLTPLKHLREKNFKTITELTKKSLKNVKH